jgi:nascent polypeptide-associated complex subunit alpha
MMPGMGGIDPKKMQAMMKQMGISQEELDATRVIIEKEDGKIVIDNPQVSKVTMQGQETYQVVGEAREEEEGVSEEDVKMVAEKSGKNVDEAKEALDASGGDIAEAIMKLSG